jgi:tripartite-type tricarboxylate transporter receptor subunit TctC
MGEPRNSDRMLRTSDLRTALAALLLVLGVSTKPAIAEDWPSRPLTMVVPFAAGGPLDAIGRVMAAPLGEILGKPVVVENAAGAGGMTGSNRVARSAPDGYVFGMATAGTHAYNQTLYRKPLYDAAADFAPVGIVGESFFALLVRKDYPADTLQEFVAYAKAHQSRMQFGSAGAGSATHIVCVLLSSAMGTNIAHVPYRSTSQAMQDLMAGRIDFLCDAGSTAVPLIKGGAVKALANLGPRRVPMLPELATAEEQGLAGVSVYGWNAFFYPKGTPDPIVRALNKAVGTMLGRPDVQARLDNIGILVPPSENRSPEYLAKFVRSEIETWAAPIKASGVVLE